LRADVLRFLIRALGFLALAGALVVAVEDGARSLANGALSLQPLGGSLARLAPQKFSQLPAIVSHVSPKLWDPVLIDVLWLPTSASLLVVGAVLAALASPRRSRT
jgi:hypothetical protein